MAQFNGFHLEATSNVLIENVHFQSSALSASVGFYIVRTAGVTVRNVVAIGGGQVFSIQDCTSVLFSNIEISADEPSIQANNAPLGIMLTTGDCDCSDHISLDRLVITGASQGVVTFLYPFDKIGNVRQVNITHSVFRECEVAVEAGDNTTMAISDTIFEAASGSENAKNITAAIVIDDFPWNAASITVSRAVFSQLPAGILQSGGRVSINASQFKNVAVGLSYTPSSSSSSSGVPLGFDSNPCVTPEEEEEVDGV